MNDGTTFPLCMQHQVTNLVPSPPNGPPFLSGAAAEGPNASATKGLVTNMVTCSPNGVDQFSQFNSSSAVYKDNVQSYDTVEPAIDLTASSFLAFAWQIAGAPSGNSQYVDGEGILGSAAISAPDSLPHRLRSFLSPSNISSGILTQISQ